MPGYGLAAAQAQREAGELGKALTERGITVFYAIHPVAGRMPGHMNVLLAEADVPYAQLLEMDDVNPEFPTCDVALVVGANDVTNPAARRTGNAISGMPILDVDKARSIVVIKRSMGHGYAGLDNELYTDPKTGMLFADAKKGLGQILAALKEYAAYAAGSTMSHALAPSARRSRPRGYNRWLVPPAALALHLAHRPGLRVLGVQGAARRSTSAPRTRRSAWIFSLAIAVLGLTAAFGGPWIAKQGPRKAMVLAAGFWVIGLSALTAARRRDRPVVARLRWLRPHRRHRARHRLRGTRRDAHELVPRPARPCHRHGHHGLWRGAMLASPLATGLMGVFATGTVGRHRGDVRRPRAHQRRAHAVGRRGHPRAGGRRRRAGLAWSADRRRLATATSPRASAVRKPVFWLLWLVFFINITAGIGILETASPDDPGVLPFASPSPPRQASLACCRSRTWVVASAGRLSPTRSDAPRTFTVFVVVGAAVYAALALTGSAAVGRVRAPRLCADLVLRRRLLDAARVPQGPVWPAVSARSFLASRSPRGRRPASPARSSSTASSTPARRQASRAPTSIAPPNGSSPASLSSRSSRTSG